MTATLRERAEHAAKYGANLVVPARDIKQLLDQLEQDQAARTRVLDLHQPDAVGNCGHCTRGRVYPVPSLCPTVAAAILQEGAES